MGPINVVVQDANNLVLEVTPTAETSVILDRGIAGPVGMVWKGNWSSATLYIPNDVVFNAANNASYICIVQNTNQQPPNATYWNLLVAGFPGGDVNGPASATDNAIARFDGTTGKLIQNSNVTISDTGNLTYSAGTANGVAYLNGSKVLTTGSALTFDGTNLTVAGTGQLRFDTSGGAGANFIQTVNSFDMRLYCGRGSTSFIDVGTDGQKFGIGGSEQMRLTSTGLGIGTSSPASRLQVNGTVTATGWSGGGIVTETATQTLTNKTISADNNTLSGIAASSFVLSNASGNIDGAAAQKVIPTGIVVGTTDAQTLTNKTVRQMTQVISTNTTAVASNIYVLTATLTLTLPASPTAGDWVGFSNRSTTITAIIARNSQNIMGLAENMILDNINASGTLVYADATRGWVFVN